MTRHNKIARMRARRERGFSMLEILMTLFLLTMWLLASAGVQTSSLQYTKAASFRTQAVYLATELGERMQTNKTAAVAGSYVYSYSGGSTSSGTDCTTAVCTTAQLATFDLAEWSRRLSAALPNASVNVTQVTAGNPYTYQILIAWTDRRTERTYSSTGTTEAFSYTATVTVFNDPAS